MNRYYDVRVDGQVYTCQLKGQIRRHPDPEYHLPVVGDQVVIERTASGEAIDGFLNSILPRTNRLIRSLGDAREKHKVMAANLARTLIVSAIEKPGCDWALLDRFLITCALAEIPACIVINKVDLDPDALRAPELTVYRDLGYPVIETSPKSGVGLGRLKAVVEDGISLFVGTSGVGKSTLINWISPNADLTTRSVSEKYGTGRHTTTHSVLIPIQGGGVLADSPGLRDFYPPLVDPDQVRFGYLEIAETQADCRFASCLHRDEPACAVREAVRLGEIAPFRFRNYRWILDDMQQRQQSRFA